MGGGIGPQESPATEFWMCPGMSFNRSDDTAHAGGSRALVAQSSFERSPV